MQTGIIEQRCALCRQSLEGLEPKRMLLPILNLLRGSQQGMMHGNLCVVCRYRVCGSCVDRRASARRGGPVCRECAAGPPQETPPKTKEDSP